ncbi:50S ribosomal protein L13 [bacterium Unc6]|nr:50S ribosomal protein L13 [bacterium Unc6]
MEKQTIQWHLMDAKGKVLGRLAIQIAKILQGKHRVEYQRHLAGNHDGVVVINVESITVTGNKDKQKVYTKYSGYPGGLKKVSFMEMKKKAPCEIIRHAVKGMLPKNKLQARMLRHLKIFEKEAPLSVLSMCK